MANRVIVIVSGTRAAKQLPNRTSLLAFKGKALYFSSQLILKKNSVVPIIDAVADTSADLMTDKSEVFKQTGKQFASHQSVYHMAKVYARCDTHIHTAESFNSMLERAKSGVFHFMSPKHLCRYLTELSFRWSNRDPKEVVTKMGKRKITWEPKPVMEQITSLLPLAYGTQLRWLRTGAVRQINSP